MKMEIKNLKVNILKTKNLEKKFVIMKMEIYNLKHFLQTTNRTDNVLITIKMGKKKMNFICQMG